MIGTPPADDVARENRRSARIRSKAEIDSELDGALADTFPASDPPSVSQPVRHGFAGDPRVKP